jgi:hypothetical protein
MSFFAQIDCGKGNTTTCSRASKAFWFPFIYFYIKLLAHASYISHIHGTDACLHVNLVFHLLSPSINVVEISPNVCFVEASLLPIYILYLFPIYKEFGPMEACF